MFNSLHLSLLLCIVKDRDFKMRLESIAVGCTSVIFSTLADVGNFCRCVLLICPLSLRKFKFNLFSLMK